MVCGFNWVTQILLLSALATAAADQRQACEAPNSCEALRYVYFAFRRYGIGPVRFPVRGNSRKRGITALPLRREGREAERSHSNLVGLRSRRELLNMLLRLN